MTKIAITPNALGSGTFTLAAPNSDTDRTLTLPDEAGTVMTNARPIISGQIGGSVTDPTGDSLLLFEEFWVDQGGITYSSSTRRFTLPEDGLYRVTLNPFKDTGATATRVLIGLNTDTPTASTHYGHCYSNSATYETMCLNSIISCSADDYIVFRLLEGTLYNQPGDRFNQFTVEKVA